MTRKNAAILLTAALFLAGAAPSYADTISDISEIRDLDFIGLSEAQKQTALRIMNDNPCNCGCQMNIAVCRVRDHSCRRSLIFGRTIIDALRERKSESEVVDVLRAKADTFVENR